MTYALEACSKAQSAAGLPQLATNSCLLPTRATTAVVPTRAALSALPNSSSALVKALVRADSIFKELQNRTQQTRDSLYTQQCCQ